MSPQAVDVSQEQGQKSVATPKGQEPSEAQGTRQGEEMVDKGLASQ